MKMNVADAKATLKAYNELKVKAEEILSEGDVHWHGVNYVKLDTDGKTVEIAYWATARGEMYDEEEHVPIKMFADGTDLAAEWQKLHEQRLKEEARAEREAKRAMAREKKRQELAELKRLKAKYPNA
jgi:hypothetical protein